MADRLDLELPKGDALSVVLSLTTRTEAGVEVAYDLTAVGAVTFTAVLEDLSEVAYAVGSGVVVLAPPTAGKVTVRLDGDHFPAIGTFPWALKITPAGSNDTETALYGDLAVVDFLDPAVVAIRRIVGQSVPPTNAQLLEAFGRLGSHKAVAVEYLEALLLELARQPTSWSVQGYSESWAGSISALRDELGRLRADVAAEEDGVSAGVMTVSLLERDTPRR